MELRSIAAGCALGMLAAVPQAATAQGAGAYPDRAVRIIVPYPAGGSTDILTRLLGQGLTKRWARRWWSKTAAAPRASSARKPRPAPTPTAIRC